MMMKSVVFTAQDAKALVSTASDMELRILAKAYSNELAGRRDRWVDGMMTRYLQLECAGLATSQIISDPLTGVCDRVIIAVFNDDSRRKVKTGLACCAPNDTFDWRIGTAIAFARAMGEKVPIDLF